MPKYLIIVESPTKAKHIQSFMGLDYACISSNGHICQVQSKTGSLTLFPDSYTIKWEYKAAYTKLIKIILDKSYQSIFIATDRDREGEGIGHHIHNLLIQNKIDCNTIYRITFNEITRPALTKSIANPDNFKIGLAKAAISRMCCDYLFGFTISPLLWRKINYQIKSAGRVQSPALKLICQREIERLQHYVERHSVLYIKLIHRHAYLRSLTITHNMREATINGIEGGIYACQYEESHIDHLSHAYPRVGLNTLDMQTLANRRYGISGATTMRAAQSLYEGINIDGRLKSLITYMRTESRVLSATFIDKTYTHLSDRWAKYGPFISKPPYAVNPGPHECIRPIDMSVTPEDIKPHVDVHMYKIYQLIWLYTASTFCEPFKYQRHRYVYSYQGLKIYLTINIGSADGGIRAYMSPHIDSPTLLKWLEHSKEISTRWDINTESYSRGPNRYNESALIKALEKHGIGRPSTYANIVKTLVDRYYIVQKNNSLIPTRRGLLLSYFLGTYLAPYVDLAYTKKLEEQLELIEKQELDDAQFLFSYNHTLKDSAEAVLKESVENIRSGWIQFIQEQIVMKEISPYAFTIIYASPHLTIMQHRLSPFFKYNDEYMYMGGVTNPFTSYIEAKGQVRLDDEHILTVQHIDKYKVIFINDKKLDAEHRCYESLKPLLSSTKVE